MNTNLIFSGRLGSGKTQLSQQVAEALGMRWTSFSSIIKIIAGESGIPIQREALQALGEELVANSPESLCRRVLEGAQPVNNQPIIIDGLRHREIYLLLKQLSAPRQLRCIYVDVPEAIRMERLMKRERLTVAEVYRLEQHSTEIQVANVVCQLADYTVTNDEALDATVQNILRWIKTGQF